MFTIVGEREQFVREKTDGVETKTKMLMYSVEARSEWYEDWR